jgi:hypothetical protein
VWLQQLDLLAEGRLARRLLLLRGVARRAQCRKVAIR